MKTLVVCFSRSGNTRKLGQTIAERIDADFEEIIEIKNRSGILGWLRAGRDAMTKRSTVIQAPTRNPADYDRVIVGAPVWAFTAPPPVRAFLQQHAPALRRVAFFCTMGGSGARQTFEDMQNTAGRSPEATLAVTERQLAAGCDAAVQAFLDRLPAQDGTSQTGSSAVEP